ncbi:IMP dehydrogenase [Cellulomonas hominis]|uniref:IMP dehydrogenase n=1 Tax=Cellulomonas hominis TaxID=156981 RepID=A0A511FFN2_9CELL|nr:alcohol dehydrogenase catalytic domain-containing protein [Cellulomonas hominis]MBB5473329.1 threonine dehydrogenase-like Zn-dependent dehydrogenase [Cellulomonas hominis]GEL48023.1 IMP dehydrogenase [Cellulomonas hominis]
MRAAVFDGPGRIVVVDRPDPVVAEPTDAVVRVTATCVCGSDLWYYRGQSPREHGQTIGHEFVGVVEEVGAAVRHLRPGTQVVAPFRWNDGDCPHCTRGAPVACRRGGIWGQPGADGGQGEAVRVPFADATLVPVPDGAAPPELLPSLLALSDVMGTGHHAAVTAGVRPGSTVAVVGDGAVGLCGVLAARRLGAERVVACSRHPGRQALARRVGATDVVAGRGDEAVAELLDLTDGVGVDHVLECVGTGESMRTALAAVRPYGGVGYVGLPHGVELPVGTLFGRGLTVGGGIAPARRYLPELLADVLDGTIEPGVVFDHRVGLEQIADGYRAMDERRSVKTLCLVEHT